MVLYLIRENLSDKYLMKNFNIISETNPERLALIENLYLGNEKGGVIKYFIKCAREARIKLMANGGIKYEWLFTT